MAEATKPDGKPGEDAILAKLHATPPPRPSAAIIERAKRRAALHEAGHARAAAVRGYTIRAICICPPTEAEITAGLTESGGRTHAEPPDALSFDELMVVVVSGDAAEAAFDFCRGLDVGSHDDVTAAAVCRDRGVTVEEEAVARWQAWRTAERETAAVKQQLSDLADRIIAEGPLTGSNARDAIRDTFGIEAQWADFEGDCCTGPDDALLE